MGARRSSRSRPIAHAGPAHIATDEDVRPADRDARGRVVLPGSRAAARTCSSRPRAASSSFRVHLISARRLATTRAGAEDAEATDARLSFADAPSWCSPRRGRSGAQASHCSHRRGSTPSSRPSGRRRSASAPSGSERSSATSAVSSIAAARPARAHGIGRRAENEILWLQALPFKLSADLSAEETTARRGDRRAPHARPRPARERARANGTSTAIHGRFGGPSTQHDTAPITSTLRRTDHLLPGVPTGGKKLEGRRLSVAPLGEVFQTAAPLGSGRQRSPLLVSDVRRRRPYGAALLRASVAGFRRRFASAAATPRR